MSRIPIPARILAAAILLALALVGLVLREGAARAEGQEVLLPITGYDPRELLTGHYVRFQFRNDLAPGAACPPGSGNYMQRRTTWVALKPERGRHVAAGVAASRAAALRLGPVAVRGDVDCTAREAAGPTPVILNLGIERLHTDQAQAEALQKVLQGAGEAPADSYAVVSVGRDGKARLKGVAVAGRRVDLDWF